MTEWYNCYLIYIVVISLCPAVVHICVPNNKLYSFSSQNQIKLNMILTKHLKETKGDTTTHVCGILLIPCFHPSLQGVQGGDNDNGTCVIS